MIASHTEQLIAMKAGLADPAERVCAAVRHTSRRAQAQPEWAAFVSQNALLCE